MFLRRACSGKIIVDDAKHQPELGARGGVTHVGAVPNFKPPIGV